MLWHIVRFRFAPDTDDAARAELAASLAALPDHIEELCFARAAPDLDEPDVLGLLTGFDDMAALDAYRNHPAHLPVVALARELCQEIVRLDLVTDDPPDALARTD